MVDIKLKKRFRFVNGGRLISCTSVAPLCLTKTGPSLQLIASTSKLTSKMFSWMTLRSNLKRTSLALSFSSRVVFNRTICYWEWASMIWPPTKKSTLTLSVKCRSSPPILSLILAPLNMISLYFASTTRSDSSPISCPFAYRLQLKSISLEERPLSLAGDVSTKVWILERDNGR